MTVLIDTSVWLRFLRGEEAGLVAQSWITSGQHCARQLDVATPVPFLESDQ